MINIATEASDSNLAFAKTAIHSFIVNNPKFNGVLYLLTSPDVPLSQGSLIQIKAVYQNIQILSTRDFNQFDTLSNKINYFKYLVFANRLNSVFYFNSCSLFCKSVFDLLTDEFIDQAINYFYVNDTSNIDLNFFNTGLASEKLMCDEFFKLNSINSSIPDELVIDSTLFPDPKFNQLISKLKSARVIFYRDLNSKNSSKINQIWLQKHKEANAFTNRPVNIKSIPSISKSSLPVKNSGSLNLNNPALEKYANAASYFKDKKICLIANSSALLDYQNGEFIDSHDIIVRFNGYRIETESTGSLTNIHCVFREYQYPSLDNIDYKIVISNSLLKWKESISKYHSIDAINQKYKILDFNYPNRQHLNQAGCQRISVPTSGLAVFVYLHSLGLSKNVNLFGFNGYCGGDKSTILRNNNDSSLAAAHNYQIESEYWSTQFNEILPGVLKYKHI